MLDYQGINLFAFANGTYNNRTILGHFPDDHFCLRSSHLAYIIGQVVSSTCNSLPVVAINDNGRYFAIFSDYEWLLSRSCQGQNAKTNKYIDSIHILQVIKVKEYILSHDRMYSANY